MIVKRKPNKKTIRMEKIMGMRDVDKLRELFAIPGNETVMAVISLGYRAEEPNRPERKNLDEIVKFF